jgi:hypothetical protein
MFEKHGPKLPQEAMAAPESRMAGAMTVLLKRLSGCGARLMQRL